MNNSFSLQQISRTGNLDPNLIYRQNKLNLMADFMRVKFENPKMKQSEIASQLDYSTSTLQKYSNDRNMLSPYKINLNNTNKRTKKGKNTIFDYNSQLKRDVKRPQMTSKKPVEIKKHKLKGGDPIDSRNGGENLIGQAFSSN